MSYRLVGTWGNTFATSSTLEGIKKIRDRVSGRGYGGAKQWSIVKSKYR